MYRILVADDESIERKVLCKMLQKHVGDVCSIFEAKSGREAMEVFEQEDIQIAIIDIEMPGMNGLEAARRMKASKESCIIIFLTAFDNFSYAKQAIRIRALDYLLKPYDEKEIIMVVEEAMNLIREKEGERLFFKEEEIVEDREENVRLPIIKEAVENYIKEHFSETISMHELASIMNYSDAYFCKIFKQCFKVNFTTYLASYRMERAKQLLENPLANIKEIGKACGYADSNYFARVFKHTTGMTPTEYREKTSKMNREIR